MNDKEFIKQMKKKFGKRVFPPRCHVCNKEMVNVIDSKTKKISKYLWKPNCEHSTHLRLAIG